MKRTTVLVDFEETELEDLMRRANWGEGGVRSTRVRHRMRHPRDGKHVHRVII